MYQQKVLLHQPKAGLSCRELFQVDDQMWPWKESVETTFSDNERIRYYRSNHLPTLQYLWLPDGFSAKDWIVWATDGKNVWLLGFATTAADALQLQSVANDKIFAMFKEA